MHGGVGVGGFGWWVLEWVGILVSWDSDCEENRGLPSSRRSTSLRRSGDGCNGVRRGGGVDGDGSRGTEEEWSSIDVRQVSFAEFELHLESSRTVHVTNDAFSKRVGGGIAS